MPPKGVSAGAIVRELLKRGKPKSVVMDYPRWDEQGRPVCRVRIRLLTAGETGDALANAHQHAARLLGNSANTDALAKPEDLQQNERIVEVLAVACRAVWYECASRHGKVTLPGTCGACGGDLEETTSNADGTDAPFFEHGAVEARHFGSEEELGTLARAYAALKQQSHPKLGELSDIEMRAWVDVVAKGLLDNPFAFCSREQLETLFEYAAKCLVEAEARLTGQKPTSSSSSES